MVRHLLVLMLLLAGCPEPQDDDDTTITDDDDAVDDDDSGDDDDAVDDDDSAGVMGPVLTILSPSPADSLAWSLVEVEFEIDDEASNAFEVAVTYSTDTATDQPATLTTGPHWSGFSTSQPPTWNFPGEIEWDSQADLPYFTEGVRLTLCPSNLLGQAGACRTWPDPADPPLTVNNSPWPTPGVLCEPGDVETFEFTGQEALLPLSDGICLNYEAPNFPNATPTDFSAQFLVVLVNTGAADAGFEITWDVDPNMLHVGPDAPFGDDDDSAGDDDDSAAPFRLPGPAFEDAGALLGPSHRRTAPGLGDLPDIALEASNCASILDEADVHNDPQVFRLRSDLFDVDGDRETLGANLRALGDSVAIYVDDATPLDFDYDCDGTIDQSHLLPAEGFNNCQLEAVADIIDANIAPRLADLYGDLSDVNQDCRVTVLISHKLNELTRDAGVSGLVRELVEPEIDLWAEDINLNPNSNQKEVLFAFAPDPLGLWNPAEPGPLEPYLDLELPGHIAVGWQRLINYAAHRQVGKELLFKDNPAHMALPPAEEPWLDDGLAYLAADLSGFGAIAHRDAWLYLDQTHLRALLAASPPGAFEDRGAQYLFARWLHDVYGPGVLWDLLHATTGPTNTPTQGLDSVLIATGQTEPGPLVREWAAALSVSGWPDPLVPTDPLVDPAVVPQFAEPTTALVPDPTTPVSGETYGANGYQQGFTIRGPNHTRVDGLDAAGPIDVVHTAELTSTELPLHLTAGADVAVFHPQRAFYGQVAGDYGVATIQVSGLEQPENFLLIEADSPGFIGAVIRIDDYHPIPGPGEPSIPLTAEDVAGPWFTQEVSLGYLDPAGGERRVLGYIDPPDTGTLSPSGTFVLHDTDRYALSLATAQRVGITVDRRFSDPFGTVGAFDPFLAIGPADDVPDTSDYSQWNFGHDPTIHGPCSDPTLYLWPNLEPDWIHAQGDLQPDPFWTPGYLPLVAGDGDVPGSLSCADDKDQDGIADADEPRPANLVDQLRQRQAENLLLDPAAYDATFGASPWSLDVSAPWLDASFVDIDSNQIPLNDDATDLPHYALGGRAVEGGEEAVWQGYLPAGDYVVIVGDGSGGVGPYTLSARVLPD